MSIAPDKNETGGPIAWMARHGVAANLIMFVCLVGGFIAMRNIKQEVFPDVALDIVTVSVAYPGASPEEVEDGILLAIEEAVRNLEGVYEITSVAREGMGTVAVELLTGENVFRLAQEVNSEVDRIITFPEDAEEPRVRINQFRRDVLTVVLFGDVPDYVLHRSGEDLRDFLLQSPDITQVELVGLPPLEISIEPSQEQLRRHGLTFGDIAGRLAASSMDIPAGGLKTDAGELLVRLTERRDFGEQFAELPVIVTEDGSEVLLRDIAHIDDSFADTDRYSRFNGKRAVMLDVFRVGRETPIGVADAVRGLLEDYEPMLPPGISVDIDRDRSEVYRERIGLLLKNGVIGLALVLLLLGLFLEARLAFWVMLGIPISFIGSFLFLPFVDITINMMSVFAFIISLGIVVDDAIVVGENIYHYRQKGLAPLDAAIKGAREVAVPVTFSILTNIAAFMPIYFIPGVMGNIFRMIPVVVSIVFLISLVECLFVLPAHLGHQKKKERSGISKWLHDRQQGFSRWFTWWVRHRYGPLLTLSLRHRYLTIIIALGLLTITLSYALSGRMGLQVFPIIESNFSEARITLPYGAPVAQTEAVAAIVEEGIQQVLEDCGRPELITGITTDIGQGGGHAARVRARLVDPPLRHEIMGTEEFTRRWRQAVGEIMGVEVLRFVADAGGPGGRGRPITVELTHRSMEVLEQASTELAAELEDYTGVTDVDDGFRPGKQQLDFTVLPEGKSLGMTARDVARQVRHAFYGAEVLRQQRGRNEIKVMVRLPKEERDSEQTIADLMMRTPGGTYVPFREVVAFQRGRAYTTIDRRNGRRVVQVSSDITPRAMAGEVLADLRENVLPELMLRYPGLGYSFEGHQADIRESMGSLRVSFMVALLVIYAMLAIPFRSYLQPFIVMLSIPYGVVGAFMGHLIMGYDLSIPSMFGIVALSGVVVNDALVMISFANHNQRELGMPAVESIRAAAIQRFRPILLTTLTTFGGLTPMIFETSRQARFLIPMALSLGYGILFATFIILLIVPAMYMIADDVATLLKGGKKQEADADWVQTAPIEAPLDN